MRSAVGFKGKYFTLSGIQALHTEITLNQQTQSFQASSTNLKILFCDDEDPPPDLEILETEDLEITFPKTKVNCNCYFNCKTRLTLLFSKKLGNYLCPCLKTKTGTSPPFINLHI
ncbi:MAG: hypothetical protein OIF32_06875 [Campylobacterales bacterium]|nr:hypothetical protein [Campylobacterales bacterium]